MRLQALGRCLLAALCLGSPATAAAQSLVYALESNSTSCANFGTCHAPKVHIVDAATASDLGTFVVGTQTDRGTALRLSSDGRLVFVTTVRPDTGAGTFWAVSAVTRQVLTQIAVGANPSDIALLPDNSRAYVVNNHGDSVSVVELASFTVVATIPVGHFPWRIVASPNGGAVYLTNAGSASVSKISTTTNTLAATIGVGLGPLGLDISADGSRLFVANKSDRAVSVIDANLDLVLRTLPAGTMSNPPIDVSAQSPARVFVALDDPAVGSLGPHTPSSVQLLNAADGAIVGSTTTGALQRFARAVAGSPTYVIGTDTRNDSLARIADDGASAATIAHLSSVTAGFWNAAAVDPCTFESTVTPAVFGPAGGSGTLTISAPDGCAWTIDTAAAPGFFVSGGALSGTGPATRTITVSAAEAPKLGTLVIGRQNIPLEQTIPRMNVEFTGGTVQEPFAVNGWAFDQNVITESTNTSSTGVSAVHVWAYPASGAPIFVDAASYGFNRRDISAIYGPNYARSGFRIVIGSLPSGTYTLVFFAYSTRSGTFSNAQAVSVAVERPPVLIAIDTPRPGTVNSTFTIAGWAADPAAAGGGPGIDVVHVWAYPSTGAPPVFVGQAAYGVSRPDVAAFLGPSFQNSGYGLTASLPPGDYTLVVFARSTDTRQFTSQTVRITVQ